MYNKKLNENQIKKKQLAQKFIQINTKENTKKTVTKIYCGFVCDFKK